MDRLVRRSEAKPSHAAFEAPGAAVEQRAPGRWQIATVSSIKHETPRVKSFRLELPMWMAHCPGQHYDVRLTAPDGYRAQRSYSVASSPLDGLGEDFNGDRTFQPCVCASRNLRSN